MARSEASRRGHATGIGAKARGGSGVAGCGRWWCIPLLTAAALAAFSIACRSRFDRPPAAADRVVVAFTLPAHRANAPEIAAGFERLLLPADATDLQLSIAVGRAVPGDRFRAEIMPVDGGRTLSLPAPLDAALASSVTITTTAPRDGDYLLRLRQMSAAGSEIVLTTGFRVLRLADGEPAGIR